MDGERNILNCWMIDFPYQSKYVSVQNIKTHYIDEGNSEQPIILLLHGVPTWCYLFRKIIQELISAGFRVVAPDVPGFGLTFRPLNSAFYTLQNLTSWLGAFLERLNFKKLTIVGHDWGAIIGTNYAVCNPELINGLMISNGFVPWGDCRLPMLLKAWKVFSQYSPWIPVGLVVWLFSKVRLSFNEISNYNKPFKQQSRKALRLIPALFPLGKSITDSIWKQLITASFPITTIFGKNDPITFSFYEELKQRLNSSSDHEHFLIDGGHFLPEDAGYEMASIIKKRVNETIII
ncbi:alpha/beta fold hydrolase [Carboxylicivirga linearis]|uniref:Alpha/beta fold hydrolase n=1 Tax=Carboxylicivirga linearis TaxID=1628157 RepID=A0ABS5JTT8_9BACT|nr:alpha/beta fold hydrolase [Carboxylicivirga linearis]MBS2098277.1 alpha/beta fold hydrolase [Carboxylicivirga linearis]